MKEKKHQLYIDKWRNLGWTEQEIEEQLQILERTIWAPIDKRTKKEIKKFKDKSLIISERMVNYLFGQLKIKGVRRYGASGQELDYKLMWAVDFISNEISNRAGFSKNKKGELVLFKKASQFLDFTKSLKQSEHALFKFKASEVRDWLGFSSDKMSIKDIVDLFRGLQRVIFEAESERILRDVEKGEWVETTVSSSLYSMKRKELKRIISSRWDTKDVRLTLRFDSVMGWLFLANLSCGRAGWITLPRSARHLSSGYEQNILREIRLWLHPKKYPIFELAAIAGLKGKEINKLKKSLERALTNLKKKDYIKDFKVGGERKNIKFLIIK